MPRRARQVERGPARRVGGGLVRPGEEQRINCVAVAVRRREVQRPGAGEARGAEVVAAATTAEGAHDGAGEVSVAPLPPAAAAACAWNAHPGIGGGPEREQHVDGGRVAIRGGEVDGGPTMDGRADIDGGAMGDEALDAGCMPIRRSEVDRGPPDEIEREHVGRGALRVCGVHVSSKLQQGLEGLQVAYARCIPEHLIH